MAGTSSDNLFTKPSCKSMGYDEWDMRFLTLRSVLGVPRGDTVRLFTRNAKSAPQWHVWLFWILRNKLNIKML